MTALLLALAGVGAVAFVALRARTRLRWVLGTVMDPVMLVDAEGRILGANAAACALFGRSREELLTRSLQQLVNRLEGRPADWTDWREATVVHPAGGERHITMIARAHDPAAAPRHTVTLHDLTEHRKAERRLSLIQERLSLAVSIANQFAWDWNPLTGEFSTSGRDIPLGYTPEEASRPGFWMSIMHPDDRRRVEEVLEAHLAGTTPAFEAEYRIQHRNGTYRSMLSRGRVVDRNAQGQAVRFIGINMDQTERRGLEYQLLHAQKMDALGQLAGGVAHDFNNALQAIMAATDMLALHPDRTIAASHADLDQVRHAAERAAGLTRQLLSFSKQRPSHREHVALNDMVTQMTRLVRRLIGPQIRIETRLAADAGQVLVDRALLEHAVINLSVNARDAMADAGKLTLATRRVASATPGGSDEVALEVSDTGIGMDEELVRRIFEPFFTTKEPGRGTGLGLPMVYGFVEQSGGRIEVESTPQVGTTMRIVLPRVEGGAATDGAAERMPVTGGTETILLVDDEEAIRTLCSSALRDLGYTVHEAQHGEEAVRLLSAPAHGIGLVLTDVAMPGMGGLALGRWLGIHAPSVVLGYMSGFIPGTQRDVATVDPARVLVKPFRLEALAAMVRTLLDGRPAVGKLPR